MSSQRQERVTRSGTAATHVVKIEKVVKEENHDRKRRHSSNSDNTERKKPIEHCGENLLNSGIRTRLSTGSIHMNGTCTINVTKEKELEQIMVKNIPKESPSPASCRKKLEKAVTESGTSGTGPPPKKRKIGRNDGSGEDNRNDYFCWLCHKEGTVICCELCPRVYHARCLDIGSDLPQDWVCPECEKIMRAECLDTRSKAMSMISLDMLCTLLSYVLERMQHQGSEPFQDPVDLATVPNYTDYIFNPMDLSLLKLNVDSKMYGCTEALLADSKWILHNCIIYNGTHHKLTTSAKMMIRICKHETTEIEVCPDCYLNSCLQQDNSWFCEPCRIRHPLVWAKLKGYPFWPAKVLREADGQADVRFFGAHDRAWVPYSQMFVLSTQSPTTGFKKRTSGFDHATKELNSHIKKLREKFGRFEFAPYRTPYDTNSIFLDVQLENSAKSPKKGKNFSESAGTIIKTEKSVVSKTASAVRNKYSSITSTKREYSLTPSVAGVKTVVSDKIPDGNCSDVQTRRNLNLRKKSVQKVSDPKIILKIENKLKGMNENDGIDEYGNTEEQKAVIMIENVENENVRPLEKTSEHSVDDKITKKNNSLHKLSSSASSVSENVDTSIHETKNRSGILKGLSPSKKEYLENLKKTIESCKVKLGMSKEGSSELKEIIAEGREGCDDYDDDGDKDSDDDSYVSDSAEEESDKEENHSNQGESNSSGKSAKNIEVKTDSNDLAKENVQDRPKVQKPTSDIGNAKKEEILKSVRLEDSVRTDSQLKSVTKDTLLDETGLMMEVDEEPDANQANSVCDVDREIAPSKPTEQNRNSSENIETKDKIVNKETGPETSTPDSQELTAEKKSPTSLGLINQDSTSKSDVTSTSSHPTNVTRSDSQTSKSVSQTEVGLMSPPANTSSLKRSQDPSVIMDKFAKQLMQSIQGTFGEMYEELKPTDLKQNESVKIDFDNALEKLKWEHQQELEELRHNFQLTLAEMKSCWEAEKLRLSYEVKNMCQKDRESAVQETKKKQWCANCGKEAIFYCCWNTSYCNYPCQQAHWSQHMQNCMQTANENSSAAGQSGKQINEPISNQTSANTLSGNNIGNKNEHTDLSDYKKRMRNGLTAVLLRQEEERKQERQHLQFSQPQNVLQQNIPLQYSQPQPMPVTYCQAQSMPQPSLPLQTLPNPAMPQSSACSAMGSQAVPGQSTIQLQLVQPPSTIGVPPSQPFMAVRGARPFMQPQPLVPLQAVQIQPQRGHAPTNQTVLYPMIQPKQTLNPGNFVRLPAPMPLQQSPNQNIKFM